MHWCHRRLSFDKPAVPKFRPTWRDNYRFSVNRIVKLKRLHMQDISCARKRSKVTAFIKAMTDVATFLFWCHLPFQNRKIIFILNWKECIYLCNITMTSEWARWRLKSPVSRLFTQPFIQTQIKEIIKAQRHWPLCEEITGDRWIPRTKGQ